MHECEVHGRADLVCLNDDDRAVLKDAAEWLEAFARKYAMRGFHGASQEDFGKIVGRLQGLAGRVPADAEEEVKKVEPGRIDRKKLYDLNDLRGGEGR
jgi:hypothetical protein